jgi:hypothetical protein
MYHAYPIVTDDITKLPPSIVCFGPWTIHHPWSMVLLVGLGFDVRCRDVYPVHWIVEYWYQVPGTAAQRKSNHGMVTYILIHLYWERVPLLLHVWLWCSCFE